MVGITTNFANPVQHATETLKAIENALAADNCGQFRQNLRDLLPKMEDAYRGQEDKYRNHQGASGIGNECNREIQLKWRWVAAPKFDPRLLRLFNRGHLEEARFLSMLMCIPGVQLWYETPEGGQIKWNDYGGHYGSALDGVAVGIPDVPQGAPCYTEFKTASDSKFNKFVKDGCRVENFTYYVQCQQCMHYMNLPYTLFMVVNKNTDELYAEIISYDKEIAEKYSKRAGDIIFAEKALPRISDKITFWKCRWCDVKQVCHGKEIPDVNCRTCCHWAPEQNGTYSCRRGNDNVHNKQLAMAGCAEHVFDPSLLPSFDHVGGSTEDNYTILRTRSGRDFKQGPGFITSYELVELGTKYEA
ncbi:exonuclease [Vibrio phage vB_VpaS_AL-2]|nr:exonuclease [Vibrio phage vB_VpaS_AL-2]